ncbi:hypothetical protein B566_EDAN017043, partial [Ephemera danica]
MEESHGNKKEDSEISEKRKRVTRVPISESFVVNAEMYPGIELGIDFFNIGIEILTTSYVGQPLKIFLENGQCEKFTDKDKPAEEIKKIIESLRNAFQCKLEDAQFVYYTNATEDKSEYFRGNEDFKRYEACVDIIRILLKHGADVNLQNCKGRTALMQLAERDINIDNVKYLIQHGANIKAVDSEGRTAVMIAAMNGFTEIVKYLLELGEDVVNQVDANGNTCLILRSDIYLKNNDGITPVMKALENKREN